MTDHLTFATFLLASLRLTHSQTTRAILPFALSPKNSAVAIAHLLKVIQVKHVCVMEGSTQLLFTEALKHLQPEEIPSTFAFPKFQDLYNSRTSTSAEDRLLEQVPLDKPAIILHSSGKNQLSVKGIHECFNRIDLLSQTDNDNPSDAYGMEYAI